MRHRCSHLTDSIGSTALHRIRILRPLGRHVTKLDDISDALNLENAMFRIGNLNLLYGNAIHRQGGLLPPFFQPEQRHKFLPHRIGVLDPSLGIQRDNALIQRVEDGFEKSDFVR